MARGAVSEEGRVPLLAPGDWLAAATFVALAALLRLPRLDATPGWDGDEGYNLDIAWHLWHGRTQFFALDYAFVQHPPLYYAVLAPLLGLLGPEIWVARLVAAVSGALSAGALYLAGVVASGRRPAALAALCLAGAHFSVLYSRFAYTYGLLLLWTALTLLLVLAWQRRRQPALLWAATATAALGLLSDQEGAFLPLFVAAAVWPDRRRAARALGASLAPSIFFVAIMLATQPQVTLADWSYSVFRLQGAGNGGPSGPAVTIARWLVNYLHLLRAEWWVPLGVAGLFCTRPLSTRRCLLLLAGLMALPVFALRELEPFFRTGLPLLVPLAWGVGALLDRGIDAVFATATSNRPDRPAAPGRSIRWLALTAAALVVGLPLGLEVGRSGGAILAGFTTRFDWALVRDQADARAAAAYVNSQVLPTDIALVSPAVAWLYQAQTADFFQVIARRGDAIAFYPPQVPARRFRFDPTPEAARFAVVDPYWDLWAGQAGLVRDVLTEVERWPLAWQSGQTRVYRRT